jgi:hypothetical protein
MASLAQQLTAITNLIKVLQKAETPDQKRISELSIQGEQIISQMRRGNK